MTVAIRETREELGLNRKPAFLFEIQFPPITFQGRTDWEFGLLFEAFSDEPIVPDPIEVEQGKFLTIDEREKFFNTNANQITLDARVSFSKYIEVKGL